MFIYLYVLYVYECFKEGNISMMVICYASDTTDYGKETAELSSAALHLT